MTQFPLFTPPAKWVPPAVSSLPSWANATRVAVDTETRDPHLLELGPGGIREGEVVGVSFAIEDGPSAYLPIAHKGGGNLPREQVLAYLRDQAATFRGDYVGANVGYDVEWLATIGVTFRPRRWLDVLLAAPLIDERHPSFSLGRVLQRAGLPPKDTGLLSDACAAYGFKGDPRAHLWKLPSAYVGPYGEQDAAALLPLLRKQEREIDAQRLEQVWDLESRVLPAIMAMRARGVRIDLQRLDAVDRWAEAEEISALNDLFAASGVRLGPDDVWQAEAVARALTSAGLTLPKTPSGLPSVTQGFLDRADHPAADAVVRARKMDKVRTTFVASVRAHAVGDRVHPWFNQLRRSRDEDEGSGKKEAGTISGRLSCEHPNLQQQPKRDEEIGKRWRSIYVPEDGEQWVSCDFSQQEPRMIVHYADLLGLPRAREAAQRYKTERDVDSHQMMADLAGISRKHAKTIFLGLCYGMGGGKLCRQLGYPTEMIVSARTGLPTEVAGPEGRALLDKFDEMVPFVRELSRAVERRANEVGRLRTVGGRVRRMTPDGRGGYQDAYKALNSLIQGGCADQTKTAMALAHENGFALRLQVHDELDQSGSLKTARDLARLMEECLPLRVPSVVKPEIGPSWGEIA